MGTVKYSLIFLNRPFHSLGFRMIYSSASRILCLQNEINRTRPHMSRVFIEVSTSNADLIDYSLQLENITEFLLE